MYLKWTLSWDYQNLGFDISYTPLKLTEVVKDINDTITIHLQMVNQDNFNLPCHFVSLPLSKTEVVDVFGNGADQMHSNCSIIVFREEKVYKYIIDTNESDKMKSLALLCMSDPTFYDNCQCQLPTGVKPFGIKTFLVIPMLIWPMTKEEALHCLPYFVESVAEVIESVHKGPLKQAHL